MPLVGCEGAQICRVTFGVGQQASARCIGGRASDAGAVAPWRLAAVCGEAWVGATGGVRWVGDWAGEWSVAQAVGRAAGAGASSGPAQRGPPNSGRSGEASRPARGGRPQAVRVDAPPGLWGIPWWRGRRGVVGPRLAVSSLHATNSWAMSSPRTPRVRRVPCTRRTPHTLGFPQAWGSSQPRETEASGTTANDYVTASTVSHANAWASNTESTSCVVMKCETRISATSVEARLVAMQRSHRVYRCLGNI